MTRSRLRPIVVVGALLVAFLATTTPAGAAPARPVHVELDLGPTLRNSTYASHRATFTPAHDGRTARLQVLARGRWETVSTRQQDTRGRVTFRFRPKSSGKQVPFRVRLSPTSRHGEFLSEETRVTITPLRPKVAVVAHRGDSHAAPENTLPAFRRAIDEGADAIELDVRCTRDRRLVVLHDRTLRRTTDVATKFARRKNSPVTSFTLAEIKRLDAGRWKAKRFAGTRVPELREVLDLVNDRPHTRVQVELKVGKGHPHLCHGYSRADLIRHVTDEFEGSQLLRNGRAAITSFNVPMLKAFKRAEPDTAVNAIFFERDAPTKAGLARLASMGITSVSIQFGARGRIFTPSYRATARRHHIRLTAWTINDRHKLYRAVTRLKITSVTSDQASRTIRFLR